MIKEGLKGACSEFFGEWTFFKFSDVVTFHTFFCFESNERNYLYYFTKWWKPCFLISRRVFSLIAPKRQRVCAWNLTHKALLIWLINFWYQNIWKKKKMGEGDDWVCGSEKAPIIVCHEEVPINRASLQHILSTYEEATQKISRPISWWFTVNNRSEDQLTWWLG